MIEQKFLALSNQEDDALITRREWLGIVLGLIGNGLLVLGHLKNERKSQSHNPPDNKNQLIKKVVK